MPSPNEHLFTADTPEQSCRAILQLIDNPAERARLARAGRERVLSHHAWPSSMKRLDAIVERCLSAFQPNRQLQTQSP